MPPTVEHLYVHVPFCAAKCGYCAFYSEPRTEPVMAAYVDAVTRELSYFASQLAPTTMFFGGGTPSILPAALLRQLLDAVGRARPPGAPLEWTVECNPATLSPEKTALLRDTGVNRISLGVQSFDDAMLQTLGRVHTAQAALDSFAQLRAAGFDNINLDLIFGLPGQTLEHWQATLRRAIALQPEHLATYCLILEKDTEFHRIFGGTGVSPVHAGQSEQRAGRPFHYLLPDDDQQRAMYETAIDTLTAAGYRQYEISNFARPGRECRHNIAYWQGQDYLGLGPSACSTVGGRRWENIADIDRYAAAISGQRSAISSEETLTPGLRAAERVAFGMRMNEGVPAELVQGRWDKEIADLLAAGLVEWRAGRLQPTPRGLLFADEIAVEFV